MEVSQGADTGTIRKAYRRLVLKHHPDRSKSPNAAEMFKRITEAYQVLIQPEQRALYDQTLIQKEAPARPPEPSATRRPQSRVSVTREADYAEQQSKSSIANEVSRLRSMLTKGHVAEAERFAQVLRVKDPRHPMPYAVLADIYLSRGDLSGAAQMIAYAAQFDPSNPGYQLKYEQLLEAISEGSTATALSAEQAKARQGRAAWEIGAVTLVCGLYLGLSSEAPLLPDFAPLSSWTLGLLACLAVCGVSIGAALAVGGWLDPFRVYSQAALLRVPPPFLFGLISLLNFWLAAALYFGAGMRQDNFNATTSRLAGATVLVTAALAFAFGIRGNALVALLWGGNLIYLFALLGWATADSLRSGTRS